MCLLVFAWQCHPQLPLIVAANRDEFHARPTQPLHWWPDRRSILAGRDLQAGGTWLGVSKNGRFAAVTNVRDAEPPLGGLRSRGHLVADFLTGSDTPDIALAAIDGSRYAGFNLLAGNGETLAYRSNAADSLQTLAPGRYGLSNAALDSDWHKQRRAREGLGRLLEADRIDDTSLLRLMSDRERAPADTIDDPRLGFAKAHALSAPFIVHPEYGTRSTGVVSFTAGGRVRVSERRFAADGSVTGNDGFRFDVER